MSDMFVQSYTSASTFETCPRQFEAKYVTNECPFEETDATRWGNAVHSALEFFLKDRRPLPANIPYTRQAAWMLGRATRPGRQLLVEGKFSMDRQLRPLEYWSKQGWYRSKIDVLILDEPARRAEVFDWKTGKVKQDRKQLLLYALLVFANYPWVDTVATGYVWLGARDDECIPAPVVYERRFIDSLRQQFDLMHDMIASAYEIGVFQPKPSGLCKKWCPVTRCEFHGKGGRY